MTYSNWKGSSGWGSVNDPTGVLGQIALMASAGRGQKCEDYLTQEIGTSNAFNKAHYKVQCEFAITSRDPFNGSIALCARASNYTTSVKKPLVPQQMYCGILDVFRKKAYIARTFNNRSTVLVAADVNYRISSNIKYCFSFSCYGNETVGGTKLLLQINNNPVIFHTDTQGLQLQEGTPGMQIQNGTLYVDNFAIMELDVYGNDA